MTRYLLDQEGRCVSKAVQDRRNLVAASARMNVHSLSGNGTTVQGTTGMTRIVQEGERGERKRKRRITSIIILNNDNVINRDDLDQRKWWKRLVPHSNWMMLRHPG